MFMLKQKVFKWESQPSLLFCFCYSVMSVSEHSLRWLKPTVASLRLRRWGGICSGQEIFLALSLNAAWNLGFFFFFFFFLFPATAPLASFSLHLFNIFLPQLWLEALCSLYIWLSYFHECDIPQMHGGNFIILATNVPSDSRMNWLEFCGQTLKDGATSQTHYWIHNC